MDKLDQSTLNGNLRKLDRLHISGAQPGQTGWGDTARVLSDKIKICVQSTLLLSDYALLMIDRYFIRRPYRNVKEVRPQTHILSKVGKCKYAKNVPLLRLSTGVF